MKKSTIAVFKEIFKVINISGNKNIEWYGDSLAVFFFENDFSTEYTLTMSALIMTISLGPDPSFALEDKDE